LDKDKIGVEVKITEEDIISFNKSVFYGKITPSSFIVVSLLLFFMITVQIILQPPFGKMPVFTGVLLLVLLNFLVIVPLVLKRTAVNNFKTNKLLQKTYQYQIGTEGMEICSETGNAFIKWEELYKAMETKDAFCFFISNQQAHIIPKRLLIVDLEQIELLKKYMSKVPIQKEKSGCIKKGLGIGCLAYILFFIVTLVIITLASK
jgi:hypothetical protein